MLRGEVAATQALLGSLTDAEWQRETDPGRTVRALVLHIIFTYEEIARSSWMPLARASAAAGQRRRDAARLTAADGQLAGELGYWGSQAALAAPRYLRRNDSVVFRSGPLSGQTAGHLFGVALPREAWLDRAAIAQAAGRPVTCGPHGAEIVRQALRDVSDAWSARAVLVEITGPAGGRWLVGDGTPGATVRADPVSYLRLVTGRPAGQIAATGNSGTATAFLTIRV